MVLWKSERVSTVLRKACFILMIVLVIVIGAPLLSTAQSGEAFPAQMNANQLVYSGPGTNAGIVEFAAAGRDLMAQGRDMNTAWIEIVLDGQVEGWVPAETVNPLGGDLGSLPIRGGLLDVGNGSYSAANSSIRQAEAEMLKVQRSLRIVQARFNRLQAFMGTNCSPVPKPAAPAITDAMIAAVPELAQVRNEINFVHNETVLAIQVLEEACAESNSIGEGTYNRLMQHVYSAQNAYLNLRRLVDSLTGLEYVIKD